MNIGRFSQFLFAFLSLCVENLTSEKDPCCIQNEALECQELSKESGAWKCFCSSENLTGPIHNFNNQTFVLLMEANGIDKFEACLRSVVKPTTASSFSSLVYLNITGKRTSESNTSLENFPFFKFDETISLTLSELGITHIDSKLLNKFPSANSISLRGNFLSEIGQSFQTRSMRKLLSLDLSKNSIKNIHICTFSQMKSLRSLNLSFNNIEIFQIGTFVSLNRLVFLDLSHNKLTQVSSDSFVGLYKLRQLNLGYNAITFIDFSSKVFINLALNSTMVCTNTKLQNRDPKPALSNLVSLDVSFNNIHTLTRLNIFAALYRVKQIDLSYNRIKTFSFSSFSQLSFLNFLDLSHNNISALRSSRLLQEKEVNFQSVCNATSKSSRRSKNKLTLLELKLTRNTVNVLPENAFSAIHKLSAVDVSQNKINKVHVTAFEGLPYLKSLNISGNMLHSFHLTSKLKLAFLDLSSNFLRTASSNWLNLMEKNRRGKLMIGGNRMKCDEHLADIFMSSSCNEIRESEMYTNVSIQRLYDLKLAFTENKTLTLSDPGECIVDSDVDKCNQKTHTDVQKCALQAYMKLAVLKRGKYNKKIFRLLLENVENLYKYVRIVAAKAKISDFADIKQSIIKVILEISKTIKLDAGESFLGQLTNKIAVGVTNTHSALHYNLTRKKPGLQFKVTSNGVELINNDIHTVTGTTEEECEENVEKLNREIDIFLPKSSYFENISRQTTFVAYQDAFLFPSNENVVSAVVSADIFGKNVKDLNEPIEINAIVNLTNTTSNEKFRCAHWDFKGVTWQDDGCQYVQNDSVSIGGRWRIRVNCRCSHLTNFAVILNYDTSEPPDLPEDTITHIISFVGLAASIIGLSVTIVYRINVRELRRGIPQLILLHLCICLLVLYVLILIHDKPEVTQVNSLCLVVAICLHFLLLSVWGWQVIEGISMYLLLVRVFNVKMDKFITKASVCSYGTAFVIVGSSVIFSLFSRDDSEETEMLNALMVSYRYGNTCIITYPNSVYFVVIPVSIGILVNVIIFVFIIRSLNQTTKSGAEGKSTKIVRNRLRQAVCVTSLLGITWCIGVLKIVMQSTLEKSSNVTWAFELIFSACNSTQGFFIFLMFCAARAYKESKIMTSSRQRRCNSQQPLMCSSAVNPVSLNSGHTTLKS